MIEDVVERLNISSHPASPESSSEVGFVSMAEKVPTGILKTIRREFHLPLDYIVEIDVSDGAVGGEGNFTRQRSCTEERNIKPFSVVGYYLIKIPQVRDALPDHPFILISSLGFIDIVKGDDVFEYSITQTVLDTVGKYNAEISGEV